MMLLGSDYSGVNKELLNLTRMLETLLILNKKFLSLTLFHRQPSRGVKSRVYNFVLSKLIGKYLLKSLCVELSFLTHLTESPFTFAFGFISQKSLENT